MEVQKLCRLYLEAFALWRLDDQSLFSTKQRPRALILKMGTTNSTIQLASTLHHVHAGLELFFVSYCFDLNF